MIRAAVVAAAGAALALTGLVFDVYALLLPGLGLGAAALGAAAWVSAAARGAWVEREIPSPRVEEEERWPLRIALRPGLVRPPAAELLEPLAGDEPLPLRSTGPCVRVDVRFARRGRRRLEPPRVVIHDPLRIAVREIRGTPADVLVLPRVEPVLDAGPGAGAGLPAAPSRLEATGAELELDALRPYRPGTAAARIHWPTVARTGEMVERRLVAEGDERPLVVLDARRPSGADALDRAVRAAASLVLALARGGGCGLLLPGERRPLELGRDLVAWPALHARLAAVEEAARAPVVDGGSPQTAVYWVSASARGAPGALTRMRAPVRFLVAPAEAIDGAPEFTVAGCAARRLGSAGTIGRRAA